MLEAEKSLQRNIQLGIRCQMNQHKYHQSAIVLVAVALIMIASRIDAAEIDGAHFKESLKVNNTMLKSTGIYSVTPCELLRLALA